MARPGVIYFDPPKKGPAGHYLSLDIWYVASPREPLPSLFKLCPWGQNGPRQVSSGT